jgi:protein involved in polysaccharide export with SLBB domain
MRSANQVSMNSQQISSLWRRAGVAFAFCVGLCGMAAAQMPLTQSLPVSPEALGAAAGGPIRLRQAMPAGQPTTGMVEGATWQAQQASPKPYSPGEFERFVQRQAGSGAEVQRLGAELITAAGDPRSAELSPVVPADYVIGPGDEVLVTLWGSVESDLRLVADRNGRISIPRVGTIHVSGVRYDDLPAVINRRIAQVFKNFESSVSLGQLRGIRVFVTGFVGRPGTYAVSSLSSVLGALMQAGGPSAAGSFRNIEIRRGTLGVVRLDLYDLLLRGDRSSDFVLQAGDVVHVGPVGTQVGVIGSVNRASVLELLPGETVADVLRMSGGFTAVADRSRLAVERLSERTSSRVAQLELPRDLGAELSHGDLVRAFSAVDATLSVQQQAKRVRIEGEVSRPGEYVLGASSTVHDAIRAAGGLLPAAFVFATEFTRVSVQRTQQENYERALRDLETDLARASGTQRVTTIDDAAAQTARTAASARLVERLRALRPNGRIVLQIPSDSGELPDLLLEDGDRIIIPSKPVTVGVMGSVFNAANYLHTPGRTLDDYLTLAGGPTKGADEESIFVVRANGNVESRRQRAGWLNRGGIAGVEALPGDTVFVPEEMDKSTFVQVAKDWTQIVYQFGLGIAGLLAATR